MPDTGKNPMSQQGVVVGVNPQLKDIEVGDHVLYHPFIGQPLWVAGHEYLMLEYRHLVGYLDDTGELWPLPDYVVIRPDFKPAGRPVLEGRLWIPKQLHHVDIPCSGVIVKRGERASHVAVGERVLFPPNKGNEIGLRKVWYTIKSADLLAVLAGEFEVTYKSLNTWEPPNA